MKNDEFDQALTELGWSNYRAAKELGMHPTTITYKRRGYDQHNRPVKIRKVEQIAIRCALCDKAGKCSTWNSGGLNE